MTENKEIYETLDEMDTRLLASYSNLEALLEAMETVKDDNDWLKEKLAKGEFEESEKQTLAKLFLTKHGNPEVQKLVSDDLVVKTLEPILAKVTDKDKLDFYLITEILGSDGYKENNLLFKPLINSEDENKRMLEFIIKYPNDMQIKDKIKEFTKETSESLEYALPLAKSLLSALATLSKNPMLNALLTASQLGSEVIKKDKTQDKVKETVKSIKDTSNTVKHTVQEKTPELVDKAKELLDSDTAKAIKQKSSSIFGKIKSTATELVDSFNDTSEKETKKGASADSDNPFLRDIDELMGKVSTSALKREQQKGAKMSEEIRRTQDKLYVEILGKSPVFKKVDKHQELEDLKRMQLKLSETLGNSLNGELKDYELENIGKSNENTLEKMKSFESVSQREKRLKLIEDKTEFKTDIKLNKERNDFLIQLNDVLTELPKKQIKAVNLSNGRNMLVSEPVNLVLDDTFGNVFTVNLVNQSNGSVISSYNIDLTGYVNNTIIALALAYEKAIAKLPLVSTNGLDISSIPNPVSLGEGMTVAYKNDTDDLQIGVYHDAWDIETDGIITEIISDTVHFKSQFLN